MVCAGTVQSPRMPVNHAVCEKEGAVIWEPSWLPLETLPGCATWRRGKSPSGPLLHAGPFKGLSTNAVRSSISRFEAEWMVRQ